jgi:hypothetical protein
LTIICHDAREILSGDGQVLTPGMCVLCVSCLALHVLEGAMDGQASVRKWNQSAESGVLFCKDMEAQDAN